MPSKTVFPEAIFFDWDGTLADTYNFLNNTHNHLLTTLGRPRLKDGEYKQYFGMPREILYPKIYGEQAEAAKVLFEKYVYDNSHLISPLKGARELIDFLKKQRVLAGVVSNKKGNFIAREIENFGWEGYFAAVVGAGEAVQDKPSGAPLDLAIKKAGLDLVQQAIWYVGDTENDLRCAAEIGVPCVYLRGHEEPAPLIERYKPLHFVEDCKDLLDILVAIQKKTIKK